MNSTWHSLLWKEWHEHKWKLVSITAILCGIATILLRFVEHQDAIAVTIAFIAICVIPLSAFVGLGIAAGERSRRTLPFLQALPVPMWQTGVTKLALGLVTMGISVGFTTAFVYFCTLLYQWVGVDLASATRLFEKDSFTGHWYLDFLLVNASVAASFLIWSAAAGVNRKDEISAGAVALATIIGWASLQFTIFSVLGNHALSGNDHTFSWLFALALSTVPGGFIAANGVLHDFHQTGLPEIIAVAILAHLLVATFYVLRFGRLSNLGTKSPKPAVLSSSRGHWLSAPRSSAFSAIAWKQSRESGSIAIAGIAGSIGITVIALICNLRYSATTPSELLGQVFPNMSVFLGFFVALVAGIGVCLNDVSPSINTFWRSRPIQPDLWFWVKFATGLLIVLTSIYLPIGLLMAFHVPVLANWNFPDAYLFPAVHLAVFSAAVATTCLVRQAVYAAILSIAVVYVGTIVGIGVTLLAAVLKLVPIDLSHWYDPTVLQIGFGLLMTFVVTTIVASLATRYDWGKKSRY